MFFYIDLIWFAVHCYVGIGDYHVLSSSTIVPKNSFHAAQMVK